MPRIQKKYRARLYKRKTGRPSGYQLGQRIRKYKTMTYTRNKNGYIKLLRKLPEIAVTNTGVGTCAVTDPTGSCVSITNLGLSLGASANLYDIAFSIKFRLDQVINSGDITGLCDKYKIKGAYVRVYYNNSNSSTGSLGGMPFLQYITDHDDAVVPSSANALREKMGVKFKTFSNASSYIGIKCRPVPNRQLYATGILTAYEVPNKAVWIDCSQPNVEHYAIKGIISQLYLTAPASAQQMIKFDVALVLEGKDFQ